MDDLQCMASTILPGGSTTALTTAFHNRNPLWDRVDDIWDLWIWREMLLLCPDDRRRSLQEVISGTLSVHKRFVSAAAITTGTPHERSWVDLAESPVATLRGRKR